MNLGKGQSGIEYLATYGWMLVAVSVVGGSMYGYIGGVDECSLNTEGFSQPFPTVEETYQYQNETLVMRIRNSEDSQIELSEITLSEDNEEVGIIDLNQEISGDSSENIYTNRFSTSENCITREMQIEYDSGSLSGLTTNGTLTGKLDLVPIKALFTANTTFVGTDQEIKFNASISESQEDIEYYNWSFGDGNETEGTEESVTHHYEDEAVYTVELTIEDEEGVVDTETAQIFVGGLLKSGGEIPSINVGEAVITKCMGGECSEESGRNDELAQTEGDEIFGTLFTREILMYNDEMCVTDYDTGGSDEGCKEYRKGESNPISENQNTIYGSLKVPSILPIEDQICIGNETQCS